MPPKVIIKPRYKVGSSGKHLTKGKDAKKADLSTSEFCFVPGGIAKASELSKKSEEVTERPDQTTPEAAEQHEAEKKAREQKIIADEAARRAREVNLGKSA